MLLRRTLAINAAFTGGSALVLAAFGPRLAALMGLGRPCRSGSRPPPDQSFVVSRKTSGRE